MIDCIKNNLELNRLFSLKDFPPDEKQFIWVLHEK